MIVIFLLIPISILLAVAFLAAFIWAVRTGQYEDTETPSMRMLWEDRGPGVTRPADPASGAAPDPAPRDEETKAIGAWPKISSN